MKSQLTTRSGYFTLDQSVDQQTDIAIPRVSLIVWLKTRLFIQNANLIHRAITRINFPIIQPVVVVEMTQCLCVYERMRVVDSRMLYFIDGQF